MKRIMLQTNKVLELERSDIKKTEKKQDRAK